MKTPFILLRSSAIACVLAAVTISTLQAQHPLNTWVRRTVPGLTANLSSVAFGNGVFVAVGAGSTVATSPDGSNWTVSNAGAYGDLARVRFVNGQFAAVGPTDKILYSTEGSSWTPITLPGADSYDVAYGNGVYVVAGSMSYASSNGVDWTVSRGPLDSVTFGTGRFVALPTGGAPPVGPPTYYSTNGMDWVAGAATSWTVVGRGEVIFGDGIFVGEASQWQGVQSSSDGASWCCLFRGQVTIPTVNGGLAHGQGYFVWAGYGSPDSYRHPFIYSSTNGAVWEKRLGPPNPFPPPTVNLGGISRAAAFGNDTFVFVGDAGYILQSGNLGGAPLITSQPQDRAAVVGNPASFSIQASGSAPLTYQWFHNGATLPNATNTTYSIANVLPADGGGYHAVVANSFGSVTSRVAQLSVAFLGIDCYAGVRILGVPGRTYSVEATPAIGAPNWQVLTNLVLPSSPYVWIDYESPQVPLRIYRSAELP